jgi:hypothetical protein
MCLIAFANRDRSQIPSIHLERAHARNPDAWGIMFPDCGRVRLHRDVSDHAAFQAAWKRSPLRTPIAAHFRYGTSGSMSAVMAHPFPLLEDDAGVQLAVMHNGVMRCVEDEGPLSDTAVFIRDVLQPQLEARPDLVEVEGWLRAMGAILGEDNKLLFMRGDGHVFFVNGWQGQFEESGVWYSNTYSIEPPRPKPVFGLIHESRAEFGGRVWSDFEHDDLFGQDSRGTVTIRRPYADPLDLIETYPEEILPDLRELSELELYHFVCDSSPEDVTDAILDMRGGR